jgi:DNA-binding transcriptional ArsR family regulator
VNATRDPIVVNLDDDTELRVRLCLSPHCTTLASLVEAMGDGGWGGPDSGWRRLIEQRGPALDLADLAPYTCRDGFPGFLTSGLRNPAPAFSDQVDEVRSVPLDKVRRDVLEMFPGHVPAAFQPFLDSPRAALDRLCRALLMYWDRVVRPSWPKIERFLDREILKQGYALATRDARTALNGVHPAIKVDGAELRLLVGHEHDATALNGRGLMLTPLLSAQGGILADLHGSEHVKIGYAAPGAEEFWCGSTREVDGLGKLLGPSRARVLLELRRKVTTTALSNELFLAPATVSAYLTELSSLGLVDRTRNGRWVHYALNTKGEALVALFDE